jgi:hypothetical protein
MTEFYEPWQPVIGSRVRYRYQPECPGVYGMLPGDLPQAGHPPEYDGLVGTVYEIFRYGVGDASNGHRFLVRLDEGSLTRAICAAAIELEPIQ